jgi:hypothetical protein
MCASTGRAWWPRTRAPGPPTPTTTSTGEVPTLHFQALLCTTALHLTLVSGVCRAPCVSCALCVVFRYMVGVVGLGAYIEADGFFDITPVVRPRSDDSYVG